MDLSLIIVFVAIFIGFLMHTITGFSAGMFSVSILLLAMSLNDAVVLVSFFLCAFSIIMLPGIWKNVDRKVFLELGIGIFLGLFIGVFFLKSADPELLTKMLGIFIILNVVYSFIRKQKIKISSKLGVVFGFFGGVFAGLYASGGPFNVIYATNKIDNAKVARATIIAAMSIGNFARLPFLVLQDLISLSTFMTFLYALPVFLLSIFVGRKIVHRVNDKLLGNILLAVLLLLGISLLIK